YPEARNHRQGNSQAHVDQHQFSAVTQDSLNSVIRGDDAQLRDVLLRHPALFGQGETPPMTLRRAPATATQ
ncbi:MAG: hypothetical protein ABI538_11350, partial [Pseudoxanthomonas sp.]